ncbi:hypothetical protein [Actinoplanes regularis]|uniref:hypothetical protein n=1 Tax=Actinoplanes regularis TaxID=52697 RepID=UPI002553FEFE|nr:hypothetical protein [Actinoplanes regularis]
MKRAALWLVQVVGEGNVFTKAQLRQALPNVAQVDRRMRDLRAFDWKIDTNREDVSLAASEQRFVQRGAAVWEAGKATRAGSSITQTQRHEVLMRDGYMCRSCGIGPGETYADAGATAQLDVARMKVRLPSGKQATQLVVECNRCRIGSREPAADLDSLLARVNRLPAIEKKMLATWIDRDARTFSAVEEAWAIYRTLPAEARDQVRDTLA